MPKKFFDFSLFQKVNLIGDDQGRYSLFFGDHQETIEHTHTRRGLGTGEYKYHLVQIGKYDLFVNAARARIQADEGTLTIFDRFNHAGVSGYQADGDAITNGCYIPQVPPLFQTPT